MRALRNYRIDFYLSISLKQLITVAILIFAVLFSVSLAQAQRQETVLPAKVLYRGIEASFGTKSFQVRSDISQLHNTPLVQLGGNVGVVLGNHYNRFTIRPLGLYQSVSPNSVNMYSFEIENQTYILRSFNKKNTRFDFYGIMGLDYNSNKFFGHYIANDESSLGKSLWETLPYLGRVDNTILTYGLGIEYQLLCKDSFMHFFLSGKSGLVLHSSTNSESFEDTSIIKNAEITAGVRLGMARLFLN